MTTPLTRPVAYVVVAGHDANAREGSVSLDAMNIPYATATATTALIDPDDIEDIDPRTGVRALVIAGDDLTGTSRTFNLGVRSRIIDHAEKTMTLELASDEALLMDYGSLTDDTTPWDSRSSLRALCNYVLGKIGATLEATPNPDQDVTPRWAQTNLISNAIARIDTTGWSTDLSGGVAGTIGRANTSVVREDASLTSYVQLTVTTTGTGLATLRCGTTLANSPRVSPGRVYTYSAFVYQNSGVAKTGRVAIGFRNDAFGVLSGAQATLSIPTGTWTKISVTAIAPANASVAVLTAGVSNGMASGSIVGVSGSVFAEGTRNDIWFDGARPDDAIYNYDWTPDAYTTPSTRTPVGASSDPDALTWAAGVSGWDFLDPLLSTAGLRLFCDEQRKWRLVDPDLYALPGVVTLSPFSSTRGTDQISRDEPEVWCTGVVIIFHWTDSQGFARTAVDSAGTSERVLVMEIERPYTGPGMAAGVLARRTGQGRVQEVTALSKLSATPSQQASVSLPGTIDQIGQVEAIEWGLSDGLMTVRTRALTDVIPGSINALIGTINALPGTINSL